MNQDAHRAFTIVMIGTLLLGCSPDDGPKRTDLDPGPATGCFDPIESTQTRAAVALAEAWARTGSDPDEWPDYPTNPFEIALPDCFPNPELGMRGGVIVHDLDGDGLLDFIVSGSQRDADGGQTGLIAFDWAGRGLFTVNAELKVQPEGDSDADELPNLFAPAFAVGDIDGDGQAEIVHLDQSNRVHVRTGTTGLLEYTLGPFDLPWGATQWGHLQIVDLRGNGDHDLILQADPLPHRWLVAVRGEDGSTIWSFDEYEGPKHGGFRAYDLDGDGRDEVAGRILVDDDGTRMNAWSYRAIDGHIDSLFAADILPDEDGLEIVMLEESYSDDRTALFDAAQVHWYGTHDGEEPQNAAIGNFDTDRPGLEIWNRSRFDTDQRPWVFDSNGQLIAEWVMNDVRPPSWTEKGIEQIYTIDWSGSSTDYIAGKERHREGRVAVIDALTGRFITDLDGHAKRIYVADVSGDAREEIIVLDAVDGVLRIHWNEEENVHPPKPRKWLQNVYQRAKQNYNYYSP